MQLSKQKKPKPIPDRKGQGKGLLLAGSTVGSRRMAMMRRAFHLSRMVPRVAVPALRSPIPALSQPSFSRSPMFQVTRNFSTGKQSEGAHIQVPIPMFGVTGNYASALYIAAVKADKLKVVESELNSVMEAAKNSPSFRNFIKDVSIPRKTRVKAVTEIFAETGFSNTTKNFLAVAAEHGRLKLLEGIVKKYTSLLKAHFGEVDVIVTSVAPLPEKEEKELKQLLGKQFSKRVEPKPKPLPEEEEKELNELKQKIRECRLSGSDLKKFLEKEGKRFKQLTVKMYIPERTVCLQQKIDRSILGGLIIEFEGKLIDMSIKTKLKKMEDSIQNAPAELLDI